MMRSVVVFILAAVAVTACSADPVTDFLCAGRIGRTEPDRHGLLQASVLAHPVPHQLTVAEHCSPNPSTGDRGRSEWTLVVRPVGDDGKAPDRR